MILEVFSNLNDSMVLFHIISSIRDVPLAIFSQSSPLLPISPALAEMSGSQSCMEKLNSVVQNKRQLLAVFTGWRKIYNQSKSGFIATRQIFPPPQPWEILKMLDEKDLLHGMGEGREGSSLKRVNLVALLS